ncbi:MAG TPA: Stk1 family PASTA domain-containing Ser/Thr kinase [Solirubrobacteraceae bacterium]|jgi:serine/threonine-protein kinase|nr:Stk1 family PASTA domain-containing Ser/Thr kinase [Solirubrobacteraceae bacterium]
MSAIEAGTVIDGRYRVSARLGSGGMADVYLAHDTLLGRQVALKLLHHRFAEDQEFVERFRREASSAAGLSHPNVVAVFDRGEWDGTYYIAMEYLPGRSLKAVVREHGPLSPSDATDIVVQILLAVRFAHRRGIIHRDIKPHNVILDEEGRAKVTDFGIARAGASDMTLTGSIMGTAQYLSPEQAQGHAVSETSDLYAVGVVLYELLTGSVPFEGESAVSIALKQVSVEPIPPSQRNPEVTPALDAVVMRALAKDPLARFASADEFIAALQQAREGISPAPAPAFNGVPPTQTAVAAALVVPPLPPEETDSAGDDARKRKRAWWIAAGVAVLALAAVAIFLFALKPNTGQVTVPNVSGDTQSAALTSLQRKELVPVVSLAVNAQVPSGLVVGTTPPGGTEVKKGTRVNVVVSSGPGILALPDVNHKSSAEAVKILGEKGFHPSVQYQSSGTVGKGLVISTNPAAGTEVQVGSPVTVLVSSGPQEASVPEVTGESQPAATATLTAAGLKVTVSKREVAEPTSGTVISQSPAAGTTLKVGSPVTIVVAQALKQATVPSLVGQSEAQAIATLTNDDLTSKTVQRTVTEPAKVGIVVQQSPAAGHKLSKGGEVTIAIGVLAQQTTSTSTTTTTTPTTPATPAPAAETPPPNS